MIPPDCPLCLVPGPLTSAHNGGCTLVPVKGPDDDPAAVAGVRAAFTDLEGQGTGLGPTAPAVGEGVTLFDDLTCEAAKGGLAGGFALACALA